MPARPTNPLRALLDLLWLSAFTAPVILLWVFAARCAGRHFREIEGHG